MISVRVCLHFVTVLPETEIRIAGIEDGFLFFLTFGAISVILLVDASVGVGYGQQEFF